MATFAGAMQYTIEDVPPAFRLNIERLEQENSIKYIIRAPNGNRVEVEYFTSGPKAETYEGILFDRYGGNVLREESAKEYFEDAKMQGKN